MLRYERTIANGPQQMDTVQLAAAKLHQTSILCFEETILV